MVGFYPAVETKSKYDSTFIAKGLDQEFTDFIDRFEAVVYISFGTTFMPSNEQMLKVVDMIKLTDKTKLGFIISLMDHAPSYAQIESLNLENVMLRSWVPQREVLNHPKTKIFFTHCGANGVIEALYYGVSMVGFPQ